MPETNTAHAVLGREVAVTGQIRSQEPLTIEGKVDGTIDVSGHRFTIAAQGQVRADIKAKEIDVRGSLEGNVDDADIVYIRAGARFVGEVRSRGIVIEDGGFIRGKVDLTRGASVARAV